MKRLGWLFFCGAIACSDDPAISLDASVVRDAGGSADAAVADAAPQADARAADATPAADAALADAATPIDAAAPDAASSLDAASNPDASVVTHGACASSDDCGGAPCVPVPNDPAGWHVCAPPISAATACSGGFDDCCSSSDCSARSGGACFQGPLFYCGGAAPPMGNVCAYDACTSSADCTDVTRTDPIGLCIPAGAFGEHRNACVYGDCRLDSDCSARRGGQCRPFANPCNRRLTGFHCTYVDSVCRQDSDCSATPFGYCAPGLGGTTSCQQFIPPP